MNRLVCVFSFVLLAAHLTAEQPSKLKIQFIGNEAFRITDGHTTLLTDFPYTSGAFGYMKYDSAELSTVENTLCLITHAHADHWNSELFAKMDTALIAPASIPKSVKAQKRIAFAESMDFHDIHVEAFATPHAGEHYSYVVTWNGRRLFFAGDTEDPSLLLQTKNLEAAFITPWLLDQVIQSSRRIDSKKVVVYHHLENEVVPMYQDRWVPKQGESIEIP